MDVARTRVASLLIGVATAMAIIALVIPLFLNPVWVAFEQGRAQATAWTGFTEPQLRTATDAILFDLVVGPPQFDVAVDGQPLLNDRERGHMGDVRTVFAAFYLVAAALVGVAIVMTMARRAGTARRSSWGAVRAGAVGLIIVLVAAGAVALVAFDALFAVFHRLLFSGGSYTFDPATERLVQLFPFAFWQETSIAVGVVAVFVAAVVAAIAGRRLQAAGTTAAAAPRPDPELAR